MNDLELLQRFRADVAPADPAALSRARARMLHQPAPPSRTPRRRRRLIWGLLPAGALGAAMAVALLSGDVTRPAAPPSPHAARPASPHATHPGSPGVAPPSAPPPDPGTAAGVLRLAAAEARAESELRARPGQFLYVESIEADDNVKNLETKPTWVPPRQLKRQIWLSADGSRAGLLIQTELDTGRKFDVPLERDGGKAFRTTLPTDPTAMRAWLYHVSAGTAAENGADAAAWDKIGDTLREQYVPPASRAALYEAAATIPRTTLVPRADLAGRTGVAVSLLSGPVRFDYIFDARTYDFLGERVVVVGHLAPYPKGVVSRWTAQLRMAVVDRAGQLP